MVRMKNGRPETRTTYLLKPGQTLQNTKVSERSLALILPQSSFERFTDYAKENERVALLAEREAKRLAALKEATYNMSKSWEGTAKNIQKRRREELLSRKKNEEADRLKFMKELAAKNAEERAEIIRQAEELILYRKPQCRIINQALLTAECLRELEEQVKFQRSLKDVNKKLSEEQARWVMEDVAKFREEEKKKHQERLNKIRLNKENLEKQMEQNKQDLKRIEESIRKAETEDLQNMSKEIDEIKQNELQEKKDRIVEKQEKKKAESDKQREREELEKLEERNRKKGKARQELEQQLKSIEEEQEKRKKEEAEMRLWEMLQRYKRDEFNKEWNRQHEEEEKKRRLEYGRMLKKQMAQRDAARRREKLEADDSVEVKEMINKVNERVLAYGEQVLQESRGVRPTFPIEKAIEQFKREVGLVPRFNKRDPNDEVSTISKKRRQRRAICPKPDSGSGPPKKIKPLPPVVNFLNAGLSGMCATCFVHPMDVLKNRMQMSKEGVTITQTISTIFRNEGIFKFYAGLSAGLVRQATYTTARLGIYNQLQDIYREQYSEEKPTFARLALMAATAGSMGAFVGTPAEVALVRMTSDGRLPPG
ncbi:hypothetical protein TSAR_000683 [Trichomalopsis sarcophagae]|uniref:Trichohyalin-plectin-homology domain-containing protein n=1 Tax=Trichomalopsis sarcophagae TaxID=543379 RepID=A0A232EEJ8_9HYME|nr:hypothetical protein TSAR_000683 [Trichomalopsis sarcophagae]